MKLLVAMAFRNILRNKRRTALTILLIGCGLMTMILQDGFIRGMLATMVRNATGTLLGQAQIHAPGFRQNQDVGLTVRQWPELAEQLRADTSVKAFSPRTLALGMLTSPQNVSSVLIYGVDPAREEGVSKLKQALRSGAYLSGESETEIMIGQRLAELLEVGLGDRVVLTVASAQDGELQQELFRVSGIFSFQSRDMDQGMVFIPLRKAQHLLNLENQVHEIALTFTDLNSANDAHPLLQKLNREGYEALGWKTLMPSLNAVLEMSQYSNLISALVLIAVISLGVINSMFMSIYERLFEFGLLKAVGTRPRQIAMMILLEAGALALLSCAFGLAVAGALGSYFAAKGINVFSGIEYAGATINEPIRFVLSAEQFIGFPLYVFMLTILAGLYPALHAARIIPTQAMRKSL